MRAAFAKQDVSFVNNSDRFRNRGGISEEINAVIIYLRNSLNYKSIHAR